MIPRRVAFLGLAAVILFGAGIAAAATYDDDDDTPAALEQPATSTTTTIPPDTTTTVEVTTTVAPATSSTTATTVAATTTTRRGATTTTSTTRPATTTTTRPIAACTAAQMRPAVATDKSSYGPAEQVRIHSTLHNRSSTPCSYPSFVFLASILEPGGGPITGFERVGETPGAVGPGQATEAYMTWERGNCTPQACPPGKYTVAVTWNFPGGPYTATAEFTLTA